MRLSNTVFIKAQRPPKAPVVAGREGRCRAGRLLRKPVGALHQGPGWGQRVLLTLMERNTSGDPACRRAHPPTVWPPSESGATLLVADTEESTWLCCQCETNMGTFGKLNQK